ncbi:MAG TPA: cytochrome c [Solirubrobacter sp.]|nr:cytochrome c [Solirubrobacter sp.]
MSGTETAVVVAFWAVLAAGLAVLTARVVLRGERHWTVPLAATAFFVACGLVVPGLVIAAGLRVSASTAGGVKLTSRQVEGRRAFAADCARCHTLAASNAVAPVGPDLDAIRPPAALVLDAVEHGRARGNGQMPAGLVTGQAARDVADYVAAVAGR